MTRKWLSNSLIRCIARALVPASLALNCCGLSTAHAQVPCSYSVQVLPPVDCGLFEGPGVPTAINNLGHVIGVFNQCGTPSLNSSFIWTGGKELTIVPLPPWILGFFANDLNDSGLIVGTAETAIAGQRGVVYNSKTGEWTELPPPNPTGQGWSAAHSVNNAGQVTGFRSLNDGGDPVNPWQAFIWSPTTGFTDLGVMSGPSSTGIHVSEGGSIVGWTGVGNANAGDRAFLHLNGQTTILPPVPGGTSSFGEAHNKTTVVGYGRIAIPRRPFFQFRGFVFQNGVMTVIPPVKGYRHSFVIDITDGGLAIGRSRFLLDGSDSSRPFLWHDGEIQDLNELLAMTNPTLVASSLADINEAGQIFGFGQFDGEGATFILTPSASFPADIDADCDVDVDDLLAVINNWGSSASEADVDGDGTVGITDLELVFENWSFTQ